MYNIFCFFKMDILKEKQLTLRASRRPIEYNYTNADIHHSNTTPDQGYQFPYPVKWTSDQSTQKVIGIRRISYKPSSVNIAFDLILRISADKTITIPIIYVFTEQNTFEECITAISTEINNSIREQSTEEDPTVRCISMFDKELGTYELRFEGMAHHYFKLDFKYGYDSYYDPSNPEDFNDKQIIYYRSEFLKLFNQEITKENIDKLHEYQTSDTQIKLEFNNVWNRDHFYCHASFSDSPKHIIGINKDFWPTPSVFYDYSDNSNVFDIYFTTDTQHRILPRNGVLLIQFSFIFNYTNSMLTYT